MMLGKTEQEYLAQIVLIVITNCAVLPSVFVCWKRKLYFEMIVGLGTGITSIFYHVGEVLEEWNVPHSHKWTDCTGMTPGNWHRLDNIFAVMTLNSLFFYLADFQSDKRKEFVRWATLFWTLWCQERGPWNVMYTVVPIVTAIVVTLFVKVVIERHRPRYNHHALAGSALLIAGFVFFSLGLDDKKDWLRMRHSLWHCFAGLATYFFAHCVDTTHTSTSSPSKTRKKKKGAKNGKTMSNGVGYLHVKVA